jgi:ssDNA-binding replication factor A large subunit
MEEKTTVNNAVEQFATTANHELSKQVLLKNSTVTGTAAMEWQLGEAGAMEEKTTADNVAEQFAIINDQSHSISI